MLLLTGTLILRGYIYDTIRIDIEAYLDLRNATTCREDTIQTELAEGLIISCELTLTLYDMDVYSGLVILCGREYLRSMGRNGCISLDERCCHTTEGLDGKCQRCYIEKKNITGTGITGELTTLDRRTDGYALIRVQGLARLLTGQLLYLLLCNRHTRRTTDEKNL